ncbi:MAG: MBL fold metallo-hydrolase [Myxococcales bacterium]
MIRDLDLANLLGATPGDLAARALGIVRLAIPIPLGQTGGPASVYLIDNADGSLTLFDAALGTAESLRALEKGLAEAGRRVEEVTRVIVSHGHVDHFGGARHVVGRSGAKVFVHPADASKVTRFTWPEAVRERHRRYLERMGVPRTLIVEMEGMEETNELLGERVEAVEPLVEGERIAFARFEAEVMHLPGHTAGLVGLHVPEHRLLLSADFLLPGVSPSPMLELGEGGEEGKLRSLDAYFESSQRVGSLELDWMLPGHGEPFADHRAVLAWLARSWERRRSELLERLREGPKTAFDLARRGGRVRRLQLFMTLSEVIGTLERMETLGMVRRVEREGCYRFEPA